VLEGGSFTFNENISEALDAYELVSLDSLVFIGDVHGRFDKLLNVVLRLKRMGLGNYKVVFIGDLIDNSLEQSNVENVKTLTFIKKMLEDGSAYCIMGNHEFNAIGWATKKKNTDCYLRPHSENNKKQHQAFLNQAVEGSKRHKKLIAWFKSLPLFLDFGEVRVIHACWDEEAIQNIQPYLGSDNALKEEYIEEAFTKGTELYCLCEILLKGPDISLQNGAFFLDKSETKRTSIRRSWWSNDAKTYREIALVSPEMEASIPNDELPETLINPAVEVPVIIGHYTLDGSNEIKSRSEKVACVDFNAAKGDNPLVAYRWNLHSGDEVIKNENFI
jgi:hypothetical protein